METGPYGLQLGKTQSRLSLPLRILLKYGYCAIFIGSKLLIFNTDRLSHGVTHGVVTHAI